jgi:hypothetical protein
VFAVIQTAVEAGVGGLVFVGAAYALRMDEVKTMIAEVISRVRALPARRQAKAAT